MIKLVVKLFALILMLAVVGGFFGYNYLSDWANQPRPIEGEVLVELRPGLPLRGLASQLEVKKLVSHAFLFTTWAKITGDYSKFEAGTYQFKESVSPNQIREKMKTTREQNRA